MYPGRVGLVGIDKVGVVVPVTVIWLAVPVIEVTPPAAGASLDQFVPSEVSTFPLAPAVAGKVAVVNPVAPAPV